MFEKYHLDCINIKACAEKWTLEAIFILILLN